MPKAKTPKLSKKEIAAQMEKTQEVQRQRTLARQLFPAVEQLETIYDAQTAFNAAAGHIKYGMLVKEKELKVSDLVIDLEKGNDTPMKHAVQSMLELVADESATDAMRLIEMMGSKLPEFLAMRHLKDPMNTITAEEYIAA